MSVDLYIAGHNVNLTYNLNTMLQAAGLPPWRDFTGAPCSEAGGVFANVSAALMADPVRFRAMNPPNGHGTYEQAVEAMDDLAKLCAAHPTTNIVTWL